MSVSIDSFTPNTIIESAKVNTNFDNLKSAAEDAAYRGFPWGIRGTLAVADEQGMKYICPQDLTVKKIWYKTTSGTADVRLQKDTTTIDTFSASSSVGSTTTITSAVLTAGEVLTLDITAISSGVDLWVVMECQVTTIA